MELEWLDLGSAYYTPEEYAECLYYLDLIGKYLGGDQATFWAFKQLHASPHSILDVGCGGGTLTMRLAQRYPQAQVVGIDIAPEAIVWAQEKLKQASPSLTNINFYVPPTPYLYDLGMSFDVITSTLVCHHLAEDALVDFLKQAYQIANQAVIINDLHRHRFAEIGFSFLSRLFFRNRLIIHDGLLSIKRAFTRQEWFNYLQAAEIPLHKCSISWHWPFRWIVFIEVKKRNE